MKRKLFKLEEAKALFYGGFFILIVMILQMVFKLGQKLLIIISVLLMLGAYMLESAEDKFQIMEKVRKQ